MATYIDVYNAIQANSTLSVQVYVACLNAAKTIFGEAGTVTDHASRLTWATKTVNDVAGEARRMILAVALDSTVQAALPDVPDATVQTAVDALVNFYANNDL